MITLSAQPVAQKLQAETRDRVKSFRQKLGRNPHLSVVLVGEDPASQIYTAAKGKKAEELGFSHDTLCLPASTTPSQLQATLHKLNELDTVDGILLQRPLPNKNFKESELVYWISPEKDVDAFHPENVGRLSLGLPTLAPCTPAGVMELLKHYGINPAGKIACVIGRSALVGKPICALLLQAQATVFQCHSQTRDLKSVTQQADILVVAAGKRSLIDDSFVKSGAYVVDVGIHRNEQGKVVGDVDFEKVSRVAAGVTPVPGGIGPMTITMLMQNTITAAENRMYRVSGGK